MERPLHPRLLAILDVQISNLQGARDRSRVGASMHGVRSPRALRTLLEAKPWHPSPVADQLRREAAADGIFHATERDLDFRSLYPGLDCGVFCAAHSTGKASLALLPAVADHLRDGMLLGTEAWVHGDWLAVVDRFREAVAILSGGDLETGDVAWFANLSDGLSAVLSALPGGELISTAGHFTTARYIHRHWAGQNGGTLTELPLTDGIATADDVIRSLRPTTQVVSVTQCFWRNGMLLDVESIGRAMQQVCPDAALIVDVYQSQGTVPIDVSAFPARCAVLGGSLKQMRAATGGGYAWLSNGLLESLSPRRTGWWAHAEPLEFAEPPLRVGPGAARLRTGTPAMTPLVQLNTELVALATSADGDLAEALKRAHRVTQAQVTQAIAAARTAGLDVLGPDDPSRRAAFFAVRHPKAVPLAEALGECGVVVDARGDHPGAEAGALRLSANAASFEYELLYAVQKLAELAR